MSEAVTIELSNYLEDSETQRVCLFATSRAERNSMVRRVDSGEFVCPWPELYARTSYWSQLNRGEQTLHIVKALGILHKTWAFSHATAALVHGFSVSYNLLNPIHFITETSGGGQAVEGLRHHRSKSLKSEAVGGIKVTPATQTVADCLRALPLPSAIAIGDSALRSGRIGRQNLANCLASAKGARGIRRARQIAELLDPRAESGGESFVRGRLIELGFAVHDIQMPVPDPEASWRQPFRLDIVLRRPDGGLVDLEVDGRQKYEDETMTRGRPMAGIFMDERQREARITAHGIRIVRITPKQARDDKLLLKKLEAYGLSPTVEPLT